MPPRKRETTTVENSETKIGEAVPKAVIDTAKQAVGVSPRMDPVEEIAAARGQLDALREQFAETAAKLGGGARQATQQAQATAKLFPMSSVLAVAGLTALFVIGVSRIRSSPPRTRSERALDQLQALYDRVWKQF